MKKDKPILSSFGNSHKITILVQQRTNYKAEIESILADWPIGYLMIQVLD
jgi:hypothetical protein